MHSLFLPQKFLIHRRLVLREFQQVLVLLLPQSKILFVLNQQELAEV